jgi:tRNA pseudouridine55 synthase
VNGWILLDKPYGMSSTQAGNIVRRLTKSTKAGHAGTLDPLATGVLPIALGEATKTIPYVMEGRKQYRFQVTWGEQRNTDDAEGIVVSTCATRPNREAITAVLPQFMGTIQQVPPAFSAIKIEGQRAYALARAGEAVMLKSRLVMIYDLILESIDSVDQATFLVTCGTGTYVRSLARDMAQALGSVGYVSFLRRTFVGKFHEKDTILLEKLRELSHKSEVDQRILPLGVVLDDIPAVPITVEEVGLIRQGQKIPVMGIVSGLPLSALWLEDQVVAIAENRDGFYYPKRVFNY